ncbi:P-loop containing nucleoside triphosphate hydrolase protein [Chytriomyces sp. MP71]|nr:P-loop containing nucleoside triphosphate hydrolase protein [Chytriomyces sp. MP71]
MAAEAAANHPLARTVLIGCAGASCSGKSTLTEWLSRILDLPILHQDNFFKKDSEVPVVNGLRYWDCPDALDMPAFAAFLESVKSNPSSIASVLSPNRPAISDSDIPSAEAQRLQAQSASFRKSFGLSASKEGLPVRIFLVDGFLMMSDPAVMAQLDFVIFLHCEFETLRERRLSRLSYETLEGSWTDPPNYFDDVVYPAYLQFNAKVLNVLENTAVVDSVRKIPIVFSETENALNVYCMDSGKSGLSVWAAVQKAVELVTQFIPSTTE